DPWLQRGKNALSISGAHDNPVYIVVANHYAMHFLDRTSKKAFAGPGGNEQAEPLVWAADKVPDLPQRDELSTRAEDREQYEAEIRALLVSLRDAVGAHDGDKAARLLFRGQSLWRQAYGSRAAEPDQEMAALAKVLSDRKLRLLDEEP